MARARFKKGAFLCASADDQEFFFAGHLSCPRTKQGVQIRNARTCAVEGYDIVRFLYLKDSADPALRTTGASLLQNYLFNRSLLNFGLKLVNLLIFIFGF